MPDRTGASTGPAGSGLATTIALSAGVAIQLATVWLPNYSYATTGVLVVFPGGAVGKLITAGTSAAKAPTNSTTTTASNQTNPPIQTPVTLTLGEAVQDGSAVWTIVPPFLGGITLINLDTTAIIAWDFWRGTVNVTCGSSPNQGDGGIIWPNSGSVQPLCTQPNRIQVISPGNVKLSVLGSS